MNTLGKLRNQVYTKLAESYTNKSEFKRTLNMFMSILNENTNLKKVFNIYSDIENKTIENKEIASEFIIEAVNEIKDLMSTESYKNGLTKLNTTFGDVVTEDTDFSNNLDTLVHKSGYDTLVERIESKKYLINKLTTEKVVSESMTAVTPSILVSLLTTKFNDKFDVMSESEKERFKRYTTLTSTEISESIDTLKSEITETITPLKDNSDLASLISEVESEVNNSKNDLSSLVRLEELKENLV